MLSDLLSHMRSWEQHSPVVHNNLELYSVLPPSCANTTSKMVSIYLGGQSTTSCQLISISTL